MDLNVIHARKSGAIVAPNASYPDIDTIVVTDTLACKLFT
jgi:hypothetical protein